MYYHLQQWLHHLHHHQNFLQEEGEVIPILNLHYYLVVDL
jgi:hypothetical protein